MKKYYLFALLVIIATALSFDHGPILHSVQGDSSVFIYISKLITEGKMPYLDAFDHKGPLLFLLDALGLSIGGGVVGIWFVDVLFMLISLSYGYYWIAKMFGALQGLLFVFICCSVSVLGYGGNFVESWALYFIVPISIGLVKLARKIDSPINDFISGICIAAIALLRVNMLACGIMYAGCILCQSVRKRSFSYLLTHALISLIGFLLILIPVLIWLAINHALGDFIDQYIIFNLNYISSLSKPTVGVFYVFLMISVMSIVSIFTIKKGSSGEGFILAVYLLLSFLIVSINPSYNRYFSVLAVPCALMLCCVLNSSQIKIWRMAFCSLIMISSTYFWLMSALFHTVNIAAIKGYLLHGEQIDSIFQKWDEEYEQLKDFKRFVKETESVMVIGNDCYIYELLGARTSTKYPYQSPLVRFSHKIRSDVERDLLATKDRYLICRKHYHDASVVALIPKEKYHQIASTKDFYLYECCPNEKAK